MTPARVAFFAYLPFLAPILRPIHDALTGRAACLLSGSRRAVRDFRPHVVVMAHHAHLEYFRYHLPGAVVVNVRHGMISKRNLQRLPARRSARTFDFVCIGDASSLANHARAGILPRGFWLTGYPQLDPLFRGDPPAGLPFGRPGPIVLYAPTWNLGLTSASLFGPRLVALMRARVPTLNVVIKPHPVIGDRRPRWMTWWRELARREPGVHLVEDTHADVTPFMLAADVLVSDASSVVFEFLALDRPIVLVTNPRHRADPGYDPESIIWRWRDVGEEIHDVDEAGPAVERALREPGRHAARRAHYARQLFGPRTDGKSHERIAERLAEVARQVAGETGPAEPAPGCAPGRVVWRWKDLRYLVASQPWVGAVLRHREAARFRRRARTLPPR